MRSAWDDEYRNPKREGMTKRLRRTQAPGSPKRFAGRLPYRWVSSRQRSVVVGGCRMSLRLCQRNHVTTGSWKAPCSLRTCSPAMNRVRRFCWLSTVCEHGSWEGHKVCIDGEPHNASGPLFAAGVVNGCDEVTKPQAFPRRQGFHDAPCPCLEAEIVWASASNQCCTSRPCGQPWFR